MSRCVAVMTFGMFTDPLQEIVPFELICNRVLSSVFLIGQQ